ncbi:MAG: D-alanine--D-alanine ligase [Alphaproteobacteria bacterium]
MTANRPYIPVIHGAALDRPDEADTLATAEAVAAALERLGRRSAVVRVDLDLGALRRLAAQRPAAVFNLVEALDGDCALAQLVPSALEHLGLPFTGAGGEAHRLTLSKVTAKRLMAAAGLPTPAWSRDGAGLPAGAQAIVKSETEHASLGIDAYSVVPAAKAGRVVRDRAARHGGRFFAEAFVDGREFNLSLLEGADGPRVLPPAEIRFDAFPPGRPRIVDYEAKWAAGSFAYENTPRRFDFAAADAALLDRLRALACDAWTLFEVAGYARVDFRVDEDGRLWLLEVNVNPCLAPDAGFVAAAAESGLGFDALIGAIVDAALGAHRAAA